jgi:pimeloyl-ACP methyl ester carboxylesterase
MRRLATGSTLCLLLAVAGCATAPPAPVAPTAAPAGPGVLVVFVADGAGDFRACSASMRSTAEAAGLPIDVRTFCWSHGKYRIPADQCDRERVRRQGDRLAAEVVGFRAEYPGCRIALVGHSAGCAVILRAASCLPADTVDRIALLSPSVSASYDLGRALRASRGGIDNYLSHADRCWLFLFLCVMGTTDDPHTTEAAGRVGFRWPAPSDGPHALRQYDWSPAWEAFGHDGGHFGGYAPDFLRAFVFPRLLGANGLP